MRRQRSTHWTGIMLGLSAVSWAGRALWRMYSAFPLRGKTVLITGGSRGLGLVLARELLRRGARVAICARDELEMSLAQKDLQHQGGTVIAVPCDVTRPEEVERLLRTVRAELGPIDALINNAGTIEVGPSEHMTLEDYQESMRVHFWGPLHLIHAVLPEMRQRGAGRIVNIASIGGKISVPHLLPYSVGKFALVGLSEGLRAELLKDNVLVTTVCPGLLRTGSPRNATFKGQHRKEYAWFSISDSLPLLSMNARRAARRIITALQRGEAEVILTAPAKLATWAHGLFPGLVADLLGHINGLLPSPGGIGSGRARGWQSESKLAPSILTTLSDRAATENNERHNRRQGNGKH